MKNHPVRKTRPLSVRAIHLDQKPKPQIHAGEGRFKSERFSPRLVRSWQSTYPTAFFEPPTWAGGVTFRRHLQRDLEAVAAVRSANCGNSDRPRRLHGGAWKSCSSRWADIHASCACRASIRAARDARAERGSRDGRARGRAPAERQCSALLAPMTRVLRTRLTRPCRVMASSTPHGDIPPETGRMHERLTL